MGTLLPYIIFHCPSVIMIFLRTKSAIKLYIYMDMIYYIYWDYRWDFNVILWTQTSHKLEANSPSFGQMGGECHSTVRP